MKRVGLLTAALALALAAHPAMAASGDNSAAKAAIAAAAAQMKIAAGLGDQWTPTVARFKAARAAEAKGDFAAAETAARQAEALAKASIVQARGQQKLWPQAVAR